MQYLRLSRGKYTRVSDATYLWARAWKWTAYKSRYTFYAARRANRQTFLLHREIMSRAGYDLTGMVVDHIDGDGLNNLEENLRVATIAQNAANRRGLCRTNTTGFRGVALFKQTGQYQSYIDVNGERTHFGLHETAEQAARARDAYIIAHVLAEWFPLNFPDGSYHAA